jgi:hypothetical protein
MNSIEDLHTQEALDDAIRLLYRSRPAKAAALLGLVDPTHPFSLAEKDASDKVSAQLGGQGIPGAGPGAFSSPSGFTNQVQSNMRLSAEPIKAVTNKIKDDLVGKSKDSSPPPISDNNSSSAAMSPIAKGASLRKQAMTDQEYMMYQAGIDPMSGQGDSSLTPTQLATLGGGTVGVAAANRMRAKNVAGRQLKGIRNQYLDAVQSGGLTRKQLSNLNKELKLRGAVPGLRKAPTIGIADAYMARAEKDLTGKVLKTRYRGALPLLAAGLIGTLAYNKLNEE